MTALIIVCGLVVGFVGLGIASWRGRRRLRKEDNDLGRRLGARWFTTDTGLPYGRIGDAITGAPYSGTSQLFDYAFAAEYRGRRVVALEYSTVSHTANSTSRTRHYSVQVLGPQTPLLLILPRHPALPFLWKELTEVPVGADFDARFQLLVKDPATFPGLPPAVAAWFLARPEGHLSIIKFTGDGVEVASPGPLPGWDTTRLLNDLCDLSDLIEWAQVRPSARLELASQAARQNGLLTALSGGLLGATVIFWITAFTISNPSSGLVVIGVLVGLVVLGVGLNWLVQRRRKTR